MLDLVPDPAPRAGVQRHPFSIARAGRAVPGLLFLPEGAIGPVPLVLAQHGGSQHKEADAVLQLVRLFVAEQGWALASIDGPVHGARRADGGAREPTQAEFRALWRSADNGTEALVDDWRATLDQLLALPQIDAAAVGFVGLSMGTAYGVPLLAREPRIHAAVLGLWSADHPGSAHLVGLARQVRCPLLFQQKWDDALMSREGQAALFDALGSADKRLHVYPGTHADPQGEPLDDIKRFVVKRLGGLVTAALRAGRRPELSPDAAARRTSRFRQLTPTVTRQQRENNIPPALYEQLSAHRTYVFMAPRGLGGPISGGAGVVGGDAGEVFRVGVAVCPPGNGPNLHIHLATHETFINTKGRWRIEWGERGEHSTTLEPYDIFACPPGVMRRFENIDDQESHLLVIIQGERDAFDDVYQSLAAKRSIVAAYGPGVVDRIRPAGLRFVDELLDRETAA